MKNLTREKDTDIRAKQGKKIIKYRRRIKRTELIDNTLNKTMQVVIQNRELFNNEQSDEEIDAILKQLIHQNMVENSTQQKPTMLNKPNSKKKIHIKLLDPVFYQEDSNEDRTDEEN